MTLDDYIQQHQELYRDFAGVVASILEAAFRVGPDLVRPQQMQSRAKSVSSLRRKLQDRGLLESKTIEADLKDLAGCRLIFCINTDVELLLQSRVIFDNFEVENGVTVHQPVGGESSANRQYRAIHYIASLKPDRLALPEYSRFSGLRCEIQVQTILNHAWSETEHDILYRPAVTAGFATKQIAAIKERMSRIMTDYLLPAGYEFQNIKHDFGRIMEEKRSLTEV